MNGPPWRSLRAVMIATVQVALLAWVVRSWNRPEWYVNVLLVPVAAVAFSLGGLTPRAGDLAFEPGGTRHENRCPRCRRQELRPLVRPRAGIFAPACGYRCAACWATYHQVEGALVEAPESRPPAGSDAPEIEYPIDLRMLEGEIRFLDDPGSPVESGSPREHPDVGGVEEDRDDGFARNRGRDDGQQ